MAGRIRDRSLAQLSRRMAISTEAGLDVRQTWAREAAQTGGPLTQIRDGVASGQSICDAVDATGNFFPPLFREMVRVGETTGTLGEVYRRLADHYEHRVKIRRLFLAGIAWPMLQLVAAIAIVGMLIWMMGFIATRTGGEPIDLLGFGLVGTRGLLIYLAIIGTLAAVALLLYRATVRGFFWARPIQRAALRAPGIGGCLRTIALARMAWTLALTLNVEMDLKQILTLALRSTGNDHYVGRTDAIVADVMAGREMHEALRLSGAFPDDFVDVVQVGEESGTIVETMQRLSKQYEERAQAAVSTLAVIAGFAVWALVALLIIALIIRLAMFYIGTIYEALEY